MNFMCCKHRQQLIDDPEAAIVVWHRLTSLARQQARTAAWQKSIISYGNALDAAQICFERDPTSAEVNRYIRTACELVYTIRQCHYPCDMKLIVDVVNQNVTRNLHPADVSLLLRPLKDVSDSPMPDVHRWMEALFAADCQSPNCRHH